MSENKAGVKCLPCFWRNGSAVHIQMAGKSSRHSVAVNSFQVHLEECEACACLEYKMQPIGFVCKCSSYCEAYFILSRLTQRKAATRMWRESSSRLALHQPEGCWATGNKARAEDRERTSHRCRCQYSRSIIWNLTAAKLALRVT